MLSTRWRPQPASGPDTTGADASAAEWDLVVSGRVHALIQGSKSALRQTILSIATDLPQPLARWRPGTLWPLGVKTVIVEEVASLDDVRQRELLEWISLASRTPRIVATSSAPVYRAVCRGAFSPTLYYRLNTVLIQVG